MVSELGANGWFESRQSGNYLQRHQSIVIRQSVDSSAESMITGKHHQYLDCEGTDLSFVSDGSGPHTGYWWKQKSQDIRMRLK